MSHVAAAVTDSEGVVVTQTAAACAAVVVVVVRCCNKQFIYMHYATKGLRQRSGTVSCDRNNNDTACENCSAAHVHASELRMIPG